MGNNRFVRVFVVMVCLNAVLLGGATAVMAAPPGQSNADDWMNTLGSLFQVLNAAIVGGAWVFILESFPAWKLWDPTARGLPDWTKPVIVLLATGLSVFGLAAGQDWLLNNFPSFAPWLQVAILALAAWLASQVTFLLFKNKMRSEG